MKVLHWVAVVLVLIGGLNWLLVGACNFDLVAMILGQMSMLARIVYVLVGLSAIFLLFNIKKLAP